MLLPLLLAACAGPAPHGPKHDDTSQAHGDDSAPTDSEPPPDDSGTGAVPGLAFTAPRALSWGHFATAGVCADCHANLDGSDTMRDADGRAIAPYDLWAATTMASSSRNPYWWAALAAEQAAQPEHAAEIEAECMTCHAPALVAEARLTGGTVSLDDLLGIDDTAVMGLDGVTCTVCHQVEDDGLGEERTFSGQYPIAGNATIYGPYPDPFSHPMEMHSGYTPVEGDHVRDPGLCATCHTLTTRALDEAGTPTGEHLQEQSPFLEWRNSDAGRAGVTCQDCHVPQTDEEGDPISTVIAHNPHGGEFGQVDARSPYGRHVFVGGNAFTLRILRDNRSALQPYASEAAFDANLARTAAFLAGAARLGLGAATRDGTGVELPITVENLTGHKLPTGYPSRRLWLRVVATDASGAVVFESGTPDARGRILGADGAVRPEEEAGGPVYAHAQRVEASGDVAVWQVVMADAEDRPTFRLLSAGHYLVDDRLLPAGWDPATAAATGIAPAGVDGDADFVAGGDTVRYRLPASAARVEVELLYQSASPRHLAELYTVDDPRVRAFEAMVAAADPGPERLASASAALP